MSITQDLIGLEHNVELCGENQLNVGLLGDRVSKLGTEVVREVEWGLTCGECLGLIIRVLTIDGLRVRVS